MTNLAIALMTVLHVVLPNIGQERLKVVTEDMIAVVEEEYGGKDMKSSISKSDALAILAAVAVHESGLQESVENCTRSGDGGKSVGLGQVMRGQNWEGHTRKEICSDRKLQLKLALHVIDKCWQRTPRADASLRCYTSGDAGVHSHAANSEIKLFNRMRKTVADAEPFKTQLANNP